MFKTELERARRIRSILPDKSEMLSYGEPSWFVGNKVFAMFANNHHGDGCVAVWLPFPPGTQSGLTNSAPEISFNPPYVGARD